MSEKIQINKYISSTGYCSRREADKLIDQGRVCINESIALATSKVGDTDKVFVDDELLKRKKSDHIYIMLNKPSGITCTTDEKDKSSVISFLKHPKRIFPIGRLDKDSEGLLLLTDDGDMVNKILRAGNRHEKEYIVSVQKSIDKNFVQRMSEGLPILGTHTLPCKVKQEGNKRFRIILTQGLNRQIRRMCEYLDNKVVSLTRVRIMHLQLGNLARGKWRLLHASEIAELNALLQGSSKV